MEKKMDQTNHQVEPLVCSKCQTEYSPSEVEYFDKLRNITITVAKLEWGNMREEDEYKKMEEAHKARYHTFKEKEREFWDAFNGYMLQDFRQAINELQKEEFEQAYKALGIDADCKTLAQYRKDAIQRFKTAKQKIDFWQEANRYFIYDHILELGPLAWIPEQDIKKFGLNRTRFVLLHFPVGEPLEGLITEYIGRIVKKEKGDNAFLFRRISQLTDELQRVRRKNTEYYHKIESLKLEIAGFQKKLNEAYTELKNLRNNQTAYTRDPADIAKIHELKSFINELMDELRQYRQEKQSEDYSQPVVLEETIDDKVQDETQDLIDETQDFIKGKTIAIIGGERREHAESKDYPCEVITHDGRKHNPEFYQTLQKADIIVVLTQYISHASMWEAKAHALENDKLIHFTKSINVERIIEEVNELCRESAMQ
ncbi:DUF2325 domain-containing protein [Caldalkalibacillus thermarum]|uniref:DUF2325 domain-containing protein n=1 Tax=Caldalkalibacillus thermarum TaxID=296745 RepID=UPI00166551F0|nr:DUF2325 domain-containing protein [Caldalkalibacillus thermarum]